MPCPNGRWVWCQRLISTHGGQGRHIVTQQLDRNTGKWSYVPGSGGCPGRDSVPAMWNGRTRNLWLARTCRPPVVYDPNTRESVSWSADPLWVRERVCDLGDLDWFASTFICTQDGNEVWCATRTGIWLYQVTANKWIGYPCRQKLDGGHPAFCSSSDKRLLYWACDGRIGVFDMRKREVVDVWHFAEDIVGYPLWIAASPDGRNIWVIGDRGTVIRDLPGLANAYVTKGMAVLTEVPNKAAFVPSVKVVVLYGRGGGLYVTTLAGFCIRWLCQRGNVMRESSNYRPRQVASRVHGAVAPPARWAPAPPT